MIHGVGTDIIEIKRVEQSIERYGQRFLDRLFTLKEQEYCLKHKESARHFAGRFAAKEAIAKALGTGISDSIGWLDMEILNDRAGKPNLKLSKHVKELFGSPSLHLSISHSRDHAVAFAIAEKQDKMGIMH